MKIAIGVPHTGDIPGPFFDTFASLSRPANTGLIRVDNKPIDLARNMIAQTALADPDVTHLFFMDVDMQFHKDALYRLMERDKPVIGGTYFARTMTPTPHVYEFHHEDIDGVCPLGKIHTEDQGRWYRPMARELAAFMKRHPEYESEPACTVLPMTADTLVECDALGTGSMLIKREVLEAVGYPYFKRHETTAGGEDFFFCERAKAEGYSVWGDFSVQSTHEYRYLWMARDDFSRVFHLGQPDEHNFDEQMMLNPSPPAVTEMSQAG